MWIIVLILLILIFIVAPITLFVLKLKILLMDVKLEHFDITSNSKTEENTSKVKKIEPQKQTKKTSMGLFKEKEDYDEKLKKELIKDGIYDETSFEEEELEEDDYYFEDDK